MVAKIWISCSPAIVFRHWNKILDLQREKLRSKGELQKALKGFYPINSQSVQAVTEKKSKAANAPKNKRTNSRHQPQDNARFCVVSCWKQVAKVFVSNPEGVQRKKRRRVVSQKLSRWNFGKHLSYLEYKLAVFGISLEKISEAYSTQTCPQCRWRHKCNSRNYQCSCDYEAHRDIHGARNILSLGLNGRICITTPIKSTKYLRTAWAWSSSSWGTNHGASRVADFVKCDGNKCSRDLAAVYVVPKMLNLKSETPAFRHGECHANVALNFSIILIGR